MLRRCDAWLHAAEDEIRLRCMIAMFAFVFAIRVAFTRFAPFARIPQALFDPPWYLHFLQSPPAVGVIIGLQILGVASALYAMVARHPKIGFVIAWCCYLVLAGLRASRGKIIHPDVIVLLASVPLLVAPKVSWRGHNRDGRFGVPIRTSLVVVALAYFFTGYQKVVTSGLSWIGPSNLRWVLIDGSRARGVHGRALAEWIAGHNAVIVVVASATLILEISALVAIVWPRYRPWFAVGVTAVHGGIWLTLNLDYSLWAATVWIVMIDWSGMASRSLNRN